MSASLVGSEMCIRDRATRRGTVRRMSPDSAKAAEAMEELSAASRACLLYTSDAADDMQCVEL
eukprot:5919284-Alexandrium_andersonii.AAC.1